MKKIILYLFFPFFSFAQDGTIDNTFSTGTGADQNVYLAKELSNGKILIGGQFANFNNNSANAIARLNSDGSFDSSFNIGTGINFRVNDALIESNGKIVIVGEFSQYNGVAKNCIVRINSDGTIDNTFNINSGNIQEIGMVSKQNDKYIITGSFSSINGNSAYNIARLNSDGTSDLTFNSNGVNGGIAEHIVFPDNKILIVGAFSSCQGISRNKIAKLNADGTLDSTFMVGTGVTGTLFSVASQSDGKIIIGGNFTVYNGTNKLLLARLNSDGSLDNSFSIPSGYEIISSTILIQNNNKIVVGGWTSSLPGNDKFITRLNSDGSFDTNFSSGQDFDQAINCLSFQSDGKILVGGWFSSYDGNNVSRIVRLNNQNLLSNNLFSGESIFEFYPNPVKDVLWIKNNILQDKEIEIFDINGRNILKAKISKSKDESINLNSLKTGIYFVKYLNENIPFTKKIIKN